MAKDRVLSFEADSRFFHKRAIRSMDKQDYITAVKHLRRAMEMEPGNTEMALDLADTYARMGLYEMSNVELELLLSKDNCPEEVEFAIGCNLMAMGDYAQAYACFATYLHEHPQGEYAYLAQDGIMQIEESEAEDGIDRELEALAEQGKGALDCGDVERAVEIFEQVLEKDGSLLYVRNNLALAYMCMEDSMRAWAQLNKIFQEESANVHACCNAALMLNAEGRRDSAAAYMSRLNPDLMEELDELYKFCLTTAELKMQRELQQGLRKLLLLCPYETSMLYLYGICLYNQGRYQEASKALDKLLAIEPSNLPARELLRACGEHPEGEKPEPLPYSFDYTQEQQQKMEEFVLNALSLFPDVDAMRRIVNEDREMVEAALLGDDYLVTQTILLLTTTAGTIAEEMLRRILLSMTHSMALKQMASRGLETIGAEEPYLAYIEGRIVRMRKGQIKLNTVPPKAYTQFMGDMMQRMVELYESEEAAVYGLNLWASYLNMLDGHFPAFRDKNGWMAATRARYEQDVLEKEPDLQALAREEGTTARTILLRMRRLYEGLTYQPETE